MSRPHNLLSWQLPDHQAMIMRQPPTLTIYRQSSLFPQNNKLNFFQLRQDVPQTVAVHSVNTHTRLKQTAVPFETFHSCMPV